MTKLPFTEKAIKDYIDKCIKFWRKKRKGALSYPDLKEEDMAIYYIDAYQSVRTSLFGELLPKE